MRCDPYAEGEGEGVNSELDLMVKTMALIDSVLDQNPHAKIVVDEAYQQEADLEADRQLDERKLAQHDRNERHIHDPSH